MRLTFRIGIPFSVVLLALAAGPSASAANDPLAPVGVGALPAAAPIKPVTETLWGVKVTDNYRYMAKLDPATIAWMQAEGAYTSEVMDAIAPMAALQRRVSAFTGSFGFVQGLVAYGGRDFHEERALTERPDLFAGVIDLVLAANTLRFEFSPNGPPNIPEFGTVKTEQGFKNLYAMDSIQHVKHGVTYPAVMITTGLNDPRVSPWEPAKFAAALEASGTPNPVLLRIDAQAGHGMGSTRTQTDLQTADTIAFVKWRAGVAGWLPDRAD